MKVLGSKENKQTMRGSLKRPCSFHFYSGVSVCYQRMQSLSWGKNEPQFTEACEFFTAFHGVHSGVLPGHPETV